MKKNYVSPEALYVALADEDIIRTSSTYDLSENDKDQEHNMG